jgi:hypothetical protein
MNLVVDPCRREFLSSGSKVFDALFWRKSAELAEAFIEALNLPVLFGHQKMFCSYQRRMVKRPQLSVRVLYLLRAAKKQVRHSKPCYQSVIRDII